MHNRCSTQMNEFMGDKLPATMESATTSLKSAQQAAEVLDSSIRSLNAFRSVMSSVPLIGGFVEQPTIAVQPGCTAVKIVGRHGYPV